MDYFIDYETNNKSFLKMYFILKKLGVKNNSFFLKLHDKNLLGVDPHDKNLSEENKIRIMNEVIKNPWYFLRSVVIVPVQGGISPYELNLGNLAISWCMFNNFNFFVILPRQTGKTISIICNYLWIYLYMARNSDLSFINKEGDDAKENLRRFKNIREHLPSYLNFFDTKIDTDNEQFIRYSNRNNSIKALAPPRDFESADKKGRGRTEPLRWLDEMAFIKYLKQFYEASTPATSKAMDNAKQNNNPYGTVMSSTPGKKNTDHGKYACGVKDNAAPFNECLYDMTHSDVENYILNNSQNDILYIEYSFKQLGKTDEWLEKEKRKYKNDPDYMITIRREYLLEWIDTDADSIFTQEQIDNIMKYVKPPCSQLLIDKYYPFVFVDLDFNFHDPIFIGVDPASGHMGDNTAIILINPKTLEPVGYFKNNKVKTPEIERIILSLVNDYFPNACVIIERNNLGIGVIDHLLEHPEIKRNLYWEMKDKTTEKKPGDTRAKKLKRKVRIYGHNTTSVSRPLMIDVLFQDVNDNPERFTIKELNDDIINLERKSDGKIEAIDGQHDDLVFAYMIVRYIYSYGNELTKFMIFQNNDKKANKISKEKILENFLKIVDDTNKKISDVTLTKNIIKDIEYFNEKKKRIGNMKQFLMNDIYKA